MTADEFKALGNKAFSSGQFEEAVKHFTAAINLDPSNHVLYSNRSAAYASLKQFQNAVEDANKTVEFNPGWAKGYSRKGAALHGLGKLESALEAYKEGLKLEPTNATLLKGVEDVERAMNSDQMPPGLGNLFGADMWAKIAQNPKLSHFLADQQVTQMLQDCQRDPNNMSKYVQDPRMMQIMMGLMGLDAAMASNEEELAQAKKEAEENIEIREQKQQYQPPPMKEKAPEPELTSEESESKAKREKSDALKQKGNDHYKKREFESALNFYDQALQADETNVAVLTNKSAVLFEMEKYEESIKVCDEAIEKGREHHADFKLIGRALGRIGTCYLKLDQLDNAIKFFNKSLAEHRTPDILQKLRETETLKEERVKAAYIDPSKSEEEREKGNTFFKNNQYPEAVKCYTEAIKRNPKDAKNYSNRAAAYTKLMALPEAEKDCEEAIKLDPSFVKAYIRKAAVQFTKREFSKCIETCNLALEKDVEKKHTAEIQGQIQKAYMGTGQNQTEEGRQQALKNPEVQQILSDPVMQTILQQMQQDPAAIREHMKNPVFAKKMQVLIDAGVVSLR